MIDLRTRYLGLELAHPLMTGASPLTGDLDMVCRLEDAGASAIVMHSLHEEQIVAESSGLKRAYSSSKASANAALACFPRPWEYLTEPEEYLTQIQRIKERVGLPVIGSLNGHTKSAWLNFATQIEEAGADALELNVFHVATDAEDDCEHQTATLCDMVREVRECVKIPLAIKLSPYYCALPALARRLSAAGADGLVLFNRAFQPDVDLESLDVVKRTQLSNPHELALRLRWLAILHGTAPKFLAASGGVTSAFDAVKTVMCGAHAVQLVTAILRGGPGRLTEILQEMTEWFEEHEFPSLDAARGTLGMLRVPDPGATVRGRYVQMLQTWELAGASRPARDSE